MECPYCGEETIFKEITGRAYEVCIPCREAFCLTFIKPPQK